MSKQPDLDALAAPTPPEAIHSKPGRGASGRLSYVTARFVMDRLDAAAGPANWQDRYEDRTEGVRCGIGIRVDGEWVWKWDVGTESDIESEKGSYSDAFKRAGVKWGIARDLYDGGTTNGAGSPSPAPVVDKAAGRPLRPAATTTPPEPDWMNEASAVEAARAARGGSQTGDDGSTCPIHGKPWREGKRGFYCATRNADDTWCDEHPTQRWVQARGAVAAGR